LIDHGGRGRTPLLAFTQTIISKNTMWQVSIVKTRKNYHY
jgi:hypothetical protein